MRWEWAPVSSLSTSRPLEGFTSSSDSVASMVDAVVESVSCHNLLSMAEDLSALQC